MITEDIKKRLDSLFWLACRIGALPYDWDSSQTRLRPSKSKAKLIIQRSGLAAGLVGFIYFSVALTTDLWLKHLTMSQAFMLGGVIGVILFSGVLAVVASVCTEDFEFILTNIVRLDALFQGN